jgi:hypothetical protein
MNWMKKCNRKQIFNLTKCNVEMIIIKINFTLCNCCFVRPWDVVQWNKLKQWTMKTKKEKENDH